MLTWLPTPVYARANGWASDTGSAPLPLPSHLLPHLPRAGHPCEKHTVHLRDTQGADHLVLADMGCRNTVFNAQAQSGAFFASDMLRAGITAFRVELVDEPAHVVGPLLQGYRDVLDGGRTPGDLWSWLRTLPDANGRAHGVSPGE